jgi:general secretion pathway protein G
LEVMLVIVILVILAGVVLTNYSGATDRAKIGATQVRLKSIEDALDLFKMDLGRYPTTEEGLQALVSSDQIQDEDLVKKWKGPYLGKEGQPPELKDGWSRDYKYTSPGEHNTKSFDLYSAGPNGQEGDEDDIRNWKEETK